MYRYIYIAAVLVIALGWFSGYVVPRNPSSQIESHDPEKSPTHALLPTDINLEAMVAGGKCNIERINDVQLGVDPYLARHENELKITGWLLDDGGKRLPTSAILKFQNPERVHYFITSANLSRQDVLEHFNLPQRLLNSGFEFVIKGYTLEQGNYSVSLIMQFKDIGYICDNGRQVVIR